jgi:YD repeat-containing protein
LAQVTANASALNTVRDQLDPSKNEGYGYSASNRLQDTAGPRGELDAFTDGVGNRTFLETTIGGVTETDAYARAAGANRLSTIATNGTPTRSFTYDGAGNILSDLNEGVTTAYSYNAAGQRDGHQAGIGARALCLQRLRPACRAHGARMLGPNGTFA